MSTTGISEKEDEDDDGPSVGECARIMHWIRDACYANDARGFDAMPMCRFAHRYQLHDELPHEIYRRFVAYQMIVYEFAARHVSERVLNAMTFADRERFFHAWQSIDTC